MLLLLRLLCFIYFYNLGLYYLINIHTQSSEIYNIVNSNIFICLHRKVKKADLQAQNTSLLYIVSVW